MPAPLKTFRSYIIICFYVFVFAYSMALGKKKPPSYQPWHVGLAFEQREQEVSRYQSEQTIQVRDHHKLYGAYASYHYVGWLHAVLQGEYLTSNGGKVTNQSYLDGQQQALNYKTHINAIILQSTLGMDYQPIHLKKVRLYSGLNYENSQTQYPNNMNALMQSTQKQNIISLPIGIRALLIDAAHRKLKMQLQYQYLLYGREHFDFKSTSTNMKIPSGFALSLKANYLLKPQGFPYFLEIAPYYQYSHYRHEPFHLVEQETLNKHWLNVEDIQHHYGLICTLTFS